MKRKKLRLTLTIIVALSLVVGAVWAYYEYFIFMPKPSESRQQISAQAYLDYSIVSAKDLTLWPAGTEFQQGELAYFYAAEPRIMVYPTIKLYGLANGELSGSVVSSIYVEAVNDKAENYWSFNIGKEEEQVFTINSSEGLSEYVAKGTTLDAVASYELVNKIGEELVFRTGILQLTVKSDIKLNGIIDDKFIDKSFSISV